ncbi:DUF2326 domain-containing protein [Kineococcus sp. NBC_00420]|uniref:ABC-three component system protein n=1 Tax=Kineococcus sp. NBC_00420 TaxID=2903564 RepID=UPI002E1D23FF
MLRLLSNNLPEGKQAHFTDGLNLVVADRTKAARSKDSRNAVGKSSFVRALDFCLGGNASASHPLRRPEISAGAYQLTLDIGNSEHTIARVADDPAHPTYDNQILSLEQLRGILGASLFNLPAGSSGPSFRSLIPYYLRNEADGAFADARRIFSRQSELSTQLPLAYLFGLDLGLVQKAQEISESKKSVTALRKAARDPVLGRTLGETADLDARIATLQVQRSELEAALASFRVVDRYTDLREQADALTRAIRESNDEALYAERRARDLEQSLESEESQQPDYSYLEAVFEQVRITLPDLVRRRFEEVAQFHESVVANRRSYLEGELAAARDTETLARQRVADLDSMRAEVMRALEAGGALETFQAMQKQVGDLEGREAELRERRMAVENLRNAQVHLTRESLALEETVRMDLSERRSQIADISSMFTRMAFELYGDRRPATLTIRETPAGYSFIPTIGGDGSAGVRSVAILCFDLCLALSALRNGRGPDFLVHDSHLFDAVEVRQVALALRLIKRLCEEEGLQYIATLNSDVLDRVATEAPDLNWHTCMRLTDEYESGGYFGKRFN